MNLQIFYHINSRIGTTILANIILMVKLKLQILNYLKSTCKLKYNN